MIDPALATRTAIREHLIADPDVTALVPASGIRTGARPEDFPVVIIRDGTVHMHGRAAGGQLVATVFVDLYVWTDTGADAAQQIAAVVARRLLTWPTPAGITFDEFRHQRTTWVRDPQPEAGHGVLFIEATVRWTI